MWWDETAKMELVFGAQGRAIQALTRRIMTSEMVGDLMNRSLLNDGWTRFGENGIAVSLFLCACTEVPWRLHEGEPWNTAPNALLVGAEDALNPMASQVWTSALFSAGFRASIGPLERVWSEASKVGEAVGGHSARLFLSAAAGEVAQPRRDLHFFLDLMPFAWAGRWPCGWSDEDSLPKVR